MKILVTGATGFLGARLLAKLVSLGLPVRALYRKTPTQSDGIEWRELADIAIPPERWRDLLVDVESVVHLAGLAHLTGRAGEGRRDEFVRTNVDATGALARACGAAGVRRLVFISSIAAQRTLEDPAGQQDYGRSKLQAERMIADALAGTSTDWCCLRPPLIYGPGNPGNMARLLRLIGTGLPLPFASIRNQRSFVFVDNMIDAIVTVLRYEHPIRSVFAVSDGTDLSTPELVRALARGSGQNARLVRVPLPILRTLARVADGAGALLGRSLPFDSYSISRLTESLLVDGSAFRRTFRWQPPIDTQRALELTCRSVVGGGTV